MNKTSIIIEIRAGTGGDEAALFVADLARMYSKYAQAKGWRLTVLNSNQTSLGGAKHFTLEIEGEDAWELLRYEGGVHRVQRIPETEKSGRIHTSTVTVATLKKADSGEVAINPADLRVEFFRSSGPGGQNVNKRETAVRIIHLPTGTVVESQTERGQGANREYALSILRSRIAENLRRERQSQEQLVRREQIGAAERSEKIRTYNFPQNRLTDHRLKKSWHNLDSIMDGSLDKVLKKLAEKTST